MYELQTKYWADLFITSVFILLHDVLVSRKLLPLLRVLAYLFAWTFKELFSMNYFTYLYFYVLDFFQVDI